MTTRLRKKTFAIQEDCAIEDLKVFKGSTIVLSFSEDVEPSPTTSGYNRVAVRVQSLRSSKVQLIVFDDLDDCDLACKYFSEIERAELSEEQEFIYWDWVNVHSTIIVQIKKEDIVEKDGQLVFGQDYYGNVLIRNRISFDSVNLEL